MRIKRLNINDAMLAVVIVCVISWSMDYGLKDEPVSLTVDQETMISKLENNEVEGISIDDTDKIASVN